jgi:plastocyanin
MRRQIARLLGLAATSSFAILWLISAPAVSAGDPCYHSFDMPTSTTEATTEVKLMPCAFGPTVAQVAVGETVTFVNGPDFAHLVTGANQAWGSRDTEIRPGGTVSYTFDTAGVYPFACALHRGMAGTIVVGDAVASTDGGAAGAAATGSTTTGATAATETTSATGPLEGPAMLALAVGSGMFVGAAIVLVAVRQRHRADEQARPQSA